MNHKVRPLENLDGPPKDVLVAAAQRAEDLLRSLEQAVEVDVQDETFRSCLSTIRQAVDEGMKVLGVELNRFLEQSKWDRLVVSFFGETNAGKSTLIEALTRGDGASIGEGFKDTTRRVEEHDVGGVLLQDMPGIEGREEEVIDEIRRAVARSHVVFLVVSGGKELEQGTLRRIRDFLNDQARVHLVLNIRGKASRRKPRPLTSDANLTKLDNSVRHLQGELGGQFGKGVLLNAEIGFLASCRDPIERFVPAMAKVEEAFESRAAARQHSGLEELDRGIQVLSERAPRQTLASNASKLLSALEGLLSSLLSEKKRFDVAIGSTTKLVVELRENVEGQVLSTQRALERLVEAQFSKIRSELSLEAANCIDAGVDEAEWNRRRKRVLKEQTRQLEEKAGNIMRELAKNLEQEVRLVEGRFAVGDFRGRFSGTLDIGTVLAGLRISMTYVIAKVGDVAKRALGVLMTTLVSGPFAIAHAIIAAIGWLADIIFFDRKEKRRNAKQKARTAISEAVASHSKKVNHEIQRELTDIRRSVSLELNALEDQMNRLRDVGTAMSIRIQDLLRLKLAISTYAVRRLSDDADITGALVELGLSRACVIGGKLPRESCDLLGLRNRPLNFDDVDSLFESDGVDVDDDVAVYGGSDELILRALRAFSHERGVRRVKRGRVKE